MGLARLPSLGRIARGLADEVVAQAGRAGLWAPVAFGLGVAAYLGWKVEPPLWPVLGLCAASVGLAFAARRWSRHGGVVVLAALMATAVCGFGMGALRTRMVAAPIAPAHLGVVPVEGFVVDIETPSERGPRLLIAPVDIEGLSWAQTPRRVRIVVPPGDTPPPGSAIRVLTLLDPPPGPAAPGAYDFARDAFFEGIGGVGLAMRPPEQIELPAAPLRLRVGMALNAVRWRLAMRLARDMDAIMGSGASATGLAVAVTTSHQDWLDGQSRDDLRGSGLAHMLAIAGLHMAAVSGFAYFSVRLSVALWPWLALRVSGKKLAAGVGLLAVLVYLTLSGAHPPARRAAITASVAFAAILLDRRAISLHSLSVAALLILLIQPEVVVSPGFEMSFCATAALVSLAELWPRTPRPAGLPWPLAALQRTRDWLFAAVMVSVVAGAATSPFAIQHFNRFANYGVFANLSADLLASLVMMPALAIVGLGELLGIGAHWLAPLLWLAGWAAKAVIWLAHYFANAPGAAVDVPSAPVLALAISYLGLVFVCLWRGWLRWIGAVLSLAVLAWPRPAAPVAWIASDADDAAIVVKGQEVALKPGMRAYATQLWAQQRGFALPKDAVAAQTALFDCNRKGCAPHSDARPALAAWWSTRAPKPGQLEPLCAKAEILVLRTSTSVPPACAHELVLGPQAFAQGGAAEVFKADNGWRVSWAQPIRGQRPWTRIQW